MQTRSFAIIDCSEEKFIDDLIIMSILKVEIMLQKPPSKVKSYALVMTITCFYVQRKQNNNKRAQYI